MCTYNYYFNNNDNNEVMVNAFEIDLSALPTNDCQCMKQTVF
jgi:hypothetical protein